MKSLLLAIILMLSAVVQSQTIMRIHQNNGTVVQLPISEVDSITHITINIGNQFNPNLTYGSLTDIDSNTYRTIQIGKQIWMAENLRVTRFNDGTALNPYFSGTPTPIWVYDNNNPINNNPDSKLYNFRSIRQGDICPQGWRVPDKSDWNSLSLFLGGFANAGGKMKSTGIQYWSSPNQGATNSSGFSGISAGDGKSEKLGVRSIWWSTTFDNYYTGHVGGAAAFKDEHYLVSLDFDKEALSEKTQTYSFVTSTDNLDYTDYFSIRCMKDDSSFTPSLPNLTTSAISDIKHNKAKGGGILSTNGGARITAYGIVWSTASNPTISLPTKTVFQNYFNGSFVNDITGLNENTLYYARAYATNDAGTAYGNQVSFRTARLPVVATSGASRIDTTRYSGGGNVTDSGSAAVIARGLVWSKSPNPTVDSSNKSTNGTGLGAFTGNMTGLCENTLYYYRAYATTGIGTAYGNQLTFTTPAFSFGSQFNNSVVYGTVKDIDNNSYRTIRIGSQNWMAENLRVTKFQDGTAIGNNVSGMPSWSYYNNDASNNNTYGKLYNWEAVESNKNICPAGWRVPENEDWGVLGAFLGGSNTAGAVLKSSWSQVWECSNVDASNKTNSSGFSAVPGGWRTDDGSSTDIKKYGYWWSASTENINVWIPPLNDWGQGEVVPTTNRSNVRIENSKSELLLQNWNGANHLIPHAALKSVRCIQSEAVSSLNCNAAKHSGVLAEGSTILNSVTTTVPYTGGNGLSYLSQSINPNGGFELTATLLSGTLENGNGTLTFTITGTPPQRGMESFTFSIGGKTCTFSRSVSPPPVAAITSLNCSEAKNFGTLFPNAEVKDAYTNVYYTGGNGGIYPTQTIRSTGVEGLTATLQEGTLSNGIGTLIYAITGTPAKGGTASFALNFGGKTCTITRWVAPVAAITSLGCSNVVNSESPVLWSYAEITSNVPYTGGNGGTYESQTIQSTGVTGLRATLQAGRLEIGNGVLSYFIEGVPYESGSAKFDLSIGGKSCALMIDVNPPPPASVISLGCSIPEHYGLLYSSVAAEYVDTSIPYTGGNGGTYASQTIQSTGVTGLTATIQEGTLNKGSGMLVYKITGTPSSKGKANFEVNIGGKTCTFTRVVLSNNPPQ